MWTVTAPWLCLGPGCAPVRPGSVNECDHHDISNIESLNMSRHWIDSKIASDMIVRARLQHCVPGANRHIMLASGQAVRPTQWRINRVSRSDRQKQTQKCSSDVSSGRGAPYRNGGSAPRSERRRHRLTAAGCPSDEPPAALAVVPAGPVCATGRCRLQHKPALEEPRKTALHDSCMPLFPLLNFE